MNRPTPVISSTADNETICVLEKPCVLILRKAHDAWSRGLPCFENREGMGQPKLGGSKGGPAAIVEKPFAKLRTGPAVGV